MNNKLEEKIYNLGQKIGLTFDEREALRARLLSSIAHSERDILSPYSPLFYWRHVSMYIKPQYVSMALLAVLVIGGVSAAAESALPGQPLYQVKTSVNENVLSLLAFTPQSKAQLQTELVVRRLEEVEKLAIAGNLNASTTAQAETNINSNLAVIKDSVKQLESTNNATSAAITSSAAESALKVHEAILNTLADNGNSSVQDLATQVGIQATALSLDRASIDEKNASTTTASTTLSIDVLLNQQKTAQDAVAYVQAALASTTATSSDALGLDSTLVSANPNALPAERNDAVLVEPIATSTAVLGAVAKLQDASDFLAQGSDKLDLKNYGDAFVLFKKAEKSAVAARAILEAGDAVDIATSTVTSTVISTATSTATSTASTTAQ